jgi:hypothetical protein
MGRRVKYISPGESAGIVAKRRARAHTRLRSATQAKSSARMAKGRSDLVSKPFTA